MSEPYTFGLSSTAQHEAGHHVAAYVMGQDYTVLAVTIAGDHRAAGKVIRQSWEEPGEGQVLFLMGGVAAQVLSIERKYGGYPADQRAGMVARLSASAKSDSDEWSKIISMDQYQDFFTKALDLLREHQRLVDRLAGELEVHTTLYHEEADFILRSELEPNPRDEEILACYRAERCTAEPPADWSAPHPNIPWFESLKTFALREWDIDGEFLDKYYLGDPRNRPKLWP